MTDKEKFRKEVEKLKSSLIHGACSSQIAMETRCKEEAYNEVLSILNSLQEEPSLSNDEQKVSNAYSRKLREKRVLPTLKGDLKHKFLNEFNTLYQTLDMQLCDRCMKEPLKELCLSFATWGAYNLKHIGGISKEEITKMDSLQEEPVNRTHTDVESAMQEVEEKSRVFTEAHKGEDTNTILAQMRGEEPVSEDLGEYIDKLSKQFPEVSFAKLSRIAVRVAKWQKEHLWKPADGDDLPEIDREVIVLIKYNTQRNIHDKEYSTYKVGFGHRPNPDGWDGKNIDTNEVTHYTPKLYDKGGWNAPDIIYWLDIELPKEI